MASGAPKDIFSLQLPSRPRMLSHQTNSLPSTPRQLPRDYVLGARTPSPSGRLRGESARSVSSDSSHPMPPLRLAPVACRFMSTQTSQRRIPYTIGTDLLEKDEHKIKASLNPHEEEKLSGDMRELYDRLLPSAENEVKRNQVVKKLRKILAEEWPGKQIEVDMFGSSGNLLFTSKSDVDVCVTMKGVETTCALADTLARHGMEQVICVHAKAVPIVKIWDPELQLNCDLNLNNNVALTNTQMVKTYIQIDERIRPLAMIVKYWTKKRIINEASGGTLSSYTWTLLLINFLQTRRPPILPILSIRDHTGQPRNDFSQDLEMLRGFGNPNKETLGELLFHFFRRYGHEIDYQTAVISVRKGQLLSKEEKKWQLASNNMLCVEEPFNIDRNLGNTADDTAFRGLHLEFRQAFQRISEAQDIVTSVCEQFTFPSGDTKPFFFEKPQAQPRPIITRSRSQSNRGGANSNNTRGNRHHVHPRSGTNGRRASSATDYGQNPHPLFQQNTQIVYAPADYIMHSRTQDHQQPALAQQGIQDHLSRLSQQLSQEEHRLRAKQLLVTQAQLQQAQVQAAQIQAQAHGHISNQNRNTTVPGRISSSHSYRSPRIGSMEEPTLMAPLHRNFYYPSHLESTGPLSHQSSHQGTDTNPSSPQLTPSVPLRRTFQRTAVPTQNSTAVRSHSQPARTMGPQNPNAFPSAQYMMASPSPQIMRQDFVLPNGVQGQSYIGPFVSPYGHFWVPSTAVVEPIAREYLGYGYGASPQLMNGYPEQGLPQIPTFEDLQTQTGPSSEIPSQDTRFYKTLDPSRSPSPLENNAVYLNGAPVKASTEEDASYLSKSFPPSLPATPMGPVIVNGSHTSALRISENHMHLPAKQRRATDSVGNPNSKTIWPQSNDALADVSNQHQQTIIDTSLTQTDELTSRNAPNGVRTSPNNRLFHTGPNKSSVFNGHLDTGASTPATNSPPPRLSPDSQHDHLTPNGFTRPTMSSLDFGANNFDLLRDTNHTQMALLSPVRETPTPSPTTSRKAEQEKEISCINGRSNGPGIGALKPQTEEREANPPPAPAPYSTAIGLGITSRPEPRNGITTTDERNANGAVGTVSVTSQASHSNTWQLAAGKKGRKGRSAYSSVGTGEHRGAGGAEPMPLNESERKGG